MAFPISLHPASQLMARSTDTDIWLWTLAWDIHAFTSQPLAMFDANIFYPFKHTLAYSENLIGSAIIGAPIVWLGGSVVLTLNLLSLASIVLSALGAWLLARRLGLSEGAALVAGLVFGFAPPRFLRIDQFHLTTIQWVPFALAYLHTYFETGRARDLRIAIAFFTLQALTSGHGAAFLVLGIVMMLAWRLATGTPPAFAKRLKDVGIAGALLLVPAALIYLPYRAAQVEAGLRRPLEDWTLSTSSFFQSGSHVQQWLVAHAPTNWTWLNGPADAWLFPGLLPIALGAAALFSKERTRWLWLMMVLVCVWLAVGPPIGVWQWVYWLPGLNFVRAPSRFVILGVLALAMLAAIGFDRLTARWVSKRTLAASLVGGLLVFEFAAMPLETAPFAMEQPAIERWIAAQPGPFRFIEIPVPDSQVAATRERFTTRYMLHSTNHWWPIWQGSSGHEPPGYVDAWRQMTRFPSDESLATLKRLGITHAIVHFDYFAPIEQVEFNERMSHFTDRVQLLHQEGDGRVYWIR
jgi:hypothetical protein